MEFDRNELSKELLKDYSDDDYEFGGKRNAIIPLKFLVPLIAVVVVGFAGYAWYSDKFAVSSDKAEVPMIRAASKPVRERPEDPGGMPIANRDKTIYDAIASDQKTELPKVIHLLPAPEEPVNREFILSQRNSETDAQALAQANQEMIARMQESQARGGEVAEPREVEEKDLDAGAADAEEAETSETASDKREITDEEKAEAEAILAQETEARKAARASEDAKIKEAALAYANQTLGQKVIQKTELLSADVSVADEAAGLTVDNIQFVPVPVKRQNNEIVKKADKGFRIQLGSFRTEEDVRENWSSIKKKHNSLLGDLDLHTEKADVKDKGIFYRLQLGSLSNESEARKVCKELVEAKQGCFVVK